MADAFLGEIRIVSFPFAPMGWATCDGQLMPISQNQALWTLLGTTYGGDGQTTFALPDFRGRVPLHFGAGFARGEKGGNARYVLQESELPAHMHTVSASSVEANVPSPLNGSWSALNKGYATTHEVFMKEGALGRTGAGAGHENMQPYLVLNFVIALQGYWPDRS